MLANLFKNKKMLFHFDAGGTSSLTKATEKTMKQIKLLLLLFITGVFSSVQLRAQSVAMSVTPNVLCAGQQASLNASVTGLPAGVAPTKYEFFINNVSVGVLNSSSANVTFPSLPLVGGAYVGRVRAEFNSGSPVTSADVAFNVYHLPIPVPTISSPQVQCFRGNNFCFLNNSIQNPSSPSNPISTYIWNWGDATGDTTYNNGVTCHRYSFANTFTVFMRAIDDKGCRKDTAIVNAVKVNLNITPDFDWVRLTGPCFKSCYRFTNLSSASHDKTKRYEWDFGDGTKYVPSTTNPYYSLADSQNYYVTTHCYTRNGTFNPKLTLVDLTDCLDSVRKNTANSQGKPLPSNITFTFDVVTHKSLDVNESADTVCAQSFSSSEICFKMTPITLALPGTGDFVWNFGDPNDPTMRNLDSNTWNPCHAYSGMGTFFPTITIKNICGPGFDTTFNIYTAVTEGFRFDSIVTPSGWAPPDNDWGPNQTPPPGNQVLPHQFSNPIFLDDSVELIKDSYSFLWGLTGEMMYKYTRADNGLPVMMRGVINGQTLPSSVKVPVTFLLNLTYTKSTRKLIQNGKEVYVYAEDGFPRPNYHFEKSGYIFMGDPTPQNRLSIYTPLLNSISSRVAYGVEVVGPIGQIENPPAQILLKPWQKNQCGPDYRVEFVNTSTYWKSRKVWKRWEFDDDYAAACTSFSVPRTGFAPPNGTQYANGKWVSHPNSAMNQDRYSDHYYIYDGVTYPGKMNCKWSHDSVPTHTYHNWNRVYDFYINGKDWVAEATTGGPWYWDPVNNKLSPVQGLYNGQPWARVDNMPNPNRFWPQRIFAGSPLVMRNIPDPWSIHRGDNPYVVIPGGTISIGQTFGYVYKEDTFYINANDIIPNSNPPMTFYEYVFTRTIARCLTVRLRVADSLNHESGHPRRAEAPDRFGTILEDSMVIDNWDCNGESSVQLAFGRATPYGFAKQGKECPGNTQTGDGAGVVFSTGPSGSYPGLTPNCGQMHILLNMDSLADRKDNTPCTLDGWTGFNGGTTPGGLSRPTFNNCFNAAPFPGCPWTSPNGTTIRYHWGFNAGPPASTFNFPPPADTIGGWVTIGLQIGCGCKTIRDSILINPSGPLGLTNIPPAARQPVYVVSNDPWVVGMPANPAAPAPQSPLTPGGVNPQFIVYNYAYTDTVGRNAANTHLYIDRVDCNHANSKTTEVWYHNFVRIMNLDASFDVSPTNLATFPKISGETQPFTCRLRGKGDEITVHYMDSIMDSIKVSIWTWGDGTITEDSFWYADSPITDGFFVNGMRRVRYNWDIFGGDRVLIDSTVFPIGASGSGATDGILPRTKFKRIPYDTIDFCASQTAGQLVGKTNSSFYIADTAMMFFPVKHKFVRTSWEVTGSNAASQPMYLQHYIISTKNCTQKNEMLMPIGYIDTFMIFNSKQEPDTTFCENEEIFFHDSVRYWRYDCTLTDYDLNPNMTVSDNLFGHTIPIEVGDANYPWGYVNYRAMHNDTADFWKFDVYRTPRFKGFFTDTMYRYDENGVPRNLSALPSPPWHLRLPTDKYKLTVRVDSILRERMYWDFGDGTPIIQGNDPTHKYTNYGRYTIKMYTQDSLGFWDTCVRWVNILKPVASIEFTKRIFNCSEIFTAADSSFMAGNSGSLDQVIHNYWWFGENKIDTITPQGVDIFKPKKVSWPYRSYGEFKVKLKVTTSQGCSDSTYQTIYVKGPRPRFKLLSDTLGCAPLKIRIWNIADSLGMQDPADTPTRETIIYWGDQGSQPTSILGRRDTVEHTYLDSGVFSILAVGRDVISPNATQCPPSLYPDTVTDPTTGQLFDRPIKVYVKKFRNILSPNDTIICVGNPVVLNNTSDNAFTRFTYARFKGDSAFIDSVVKTQLPPETVSFQFDSVGRFSVQSIPRGFDPAQIPLGAEVNCVVRDTSWISVVRPYPNFDTVRVDPNAAKWMMKNTTNIPVVNSDYFEWTIYNMDGSLYTPKDGEIKGGSNPKIGNLSDMDLEFDLKNDTGSFKVCLKARHIEPPQLCEDTVCKVIKNSFITRIKIPNVFSPNDDGSNDNFVIDIEGEDGYDLQIFNRWGNKVFESKDKTKTWNGKDMNEGGECPAGVYYFIFNYQLRAQDRQSVTGTVTLIR